MLDKQLPEKCIRYIRLTDEDAGCTVAVSEINEPFRHDQHDHVAEYAEDKYHLGYKLAQYTYPATEKSTTQK